MSRKSVFRKTVCIHSSGISTSALDMQFNYDIYVHVLVTLFHSTI
uniref:Uncharacterized protein n=1 Tax=Rhizophora mucronata TaxID=61149 RepID=A0A2P2KLS5_RHIMU